MMGGVIGYDNSSIWPLNLAGRDYLEAQFDWLNSGRVGNRWYSLQTLYVAYKKLGEVWVGEGAIVAAGKEQPSLLQRFP